MAVERDKSRREGILLRMSTRDSVPLISNITYTDTHTHTHDPRLVPTTHDPRPLVKLLSNGYKISPFLRQLQTKTFIGQNLQPAFDGFMFSRPSVP